MSCFFCDGPKVAPVYNVPHRDYFAAPIGTMTMMRGYDGEPTVKVEIDTDVELSISDNTSICAGLTANVTASCHIEHAACEKYKQRPSSAGSENTGARKAITNNERREIANRLRRRRKEMDNEKPPQIPSLAATIYLLEISAAVKLGERGALFNRLADLIDRPTCTFDGTPERIGYVCSSCGQAFTRRPFMKRTFCDSTQFEIPFRFCPYCGAEVVTDDE